MGSKGRRESSMRGKGEKQSHATLGIDTIFGCEWRRERLRVMRRSRWCWPRIASRRTSRWNLVDVGEGTKESDYAGKDVAGKIVLVSASPGAAQELAVGKFGAVGLVSYQQNQKNAWWGEDENLIRWGHLETFTEHKTLAFMVSLKTARGMRRAAGARGEVYAARGGEGGAACGEL